MNSGGNTVVSLITLVIEIVVIVAWIAGMWKTFEKAGKPGWAAIIPIYNYIVLLEIIDRPMWWIVLLLCTGPIGMILVGMDMGENFGKSKGWGAVLLGILAPIGYAMVGFGDATYTRVSRQ